jgi:hypothetical protein
LGHPVTLRCDTLANPSSTAWTWKYNGFDLGFTGKTYLVDMDSTADVGRYTCIAYNEVGQSSEIEFTVGLGEGPTPSMYDLLSKFFYSLAPFFVLSTKCIDPWVLEFVVSNVTGNNHWENYILFFFNFLNSWFKWTMKSAKIRTPRLIMISQYFIPKCTSF